MNKPINLIKGHLPARHHNVRRQILPEEIAIKILDRGKSSWYGRPSYVFDDLLRGGYHRTLGPYVATDGLYISDAFAIAGGQCGGNMENGYANVVAHLARPIKIVATAISGLSPVMRTRLPLIRPNLARRGRCWCQVGSYAIFKFDHEILVFCKKNRNSSNSIYVNSNSTA